MQLYSLRIYSTSVPVWFLFALFGTHRLPTFSGTQYKWFMSIIQQTSLSLSFGTDEKAEEWEVPERSDVWLRLDTAQQRDFTWCWGFLGHPALFVHSAKVTHGKLTTRRHRQRKMITSVGSDWQLFLQLPRARAIVTETLTGMKEEKIICFPLLLHPLRQVRRLCVPSGTSIHAYRLGWFQASRSEEGISLFGESMGWKLW